MDTEETDKKVKHLLACIENEKRLPKPNRKLMRGWFNQIVQLKEDWRNTYTGQDDRFLTHTSMRTWRDDA